MQWDDVKVIDSSDANVKKYVFTKADAVAEAVLYKYPTYAERTVICCSTQSGCPVGCRFCGAGDYFVRSLTTEEIISQPARLLADTGVSEFKRLQIMFMSMGEPLLNLKNLIPALHWLHGMYPEAALLISTIGPDVDYASLLLAAEAIPTLGLQFSVHESTDEARDKLIPFKKKLTLEQISEQGYTFFRTTGRSPFFNYCVHENNNTDEDADRLAALFEWRVWQATISVICERDEHIAAANARQRELAEDFERKLQKRGFRTRVFDPAGQDDIGGGCGQLWFVQDWMKQNPSKARPSVGCGLPEVHTPGIILDNLDPDTGEPILTQMPTLPAPDSVDYPEVIAPGCSLDELLERTGVLLRALDSGQIPEQNVEVPLYDIAETVEFPQRNRVTIVSQDANGFDADADVLRKSIGKKDPKETRSQLLKDDGWMTRAREFYPSGGFRRGEVNIIGAQIDADKRQATLVSSLSQQDDGSGSIAAGLALVGLAAIG